MLLEDIAEESVQLAGRDARVSLLAHALKRRENPAEALSGLGGDADDRSIIEEEEIVPDHLGLLPLRGAATVLLADEIPFIEQDDAGLLRLLQHPGDALVLTGDAALAIDDKKSRIGPADRLLGTHGAENLDRGVGTRAMTEARGVDEDIRFIPEFAMHVERVARGPGDIADNAPLLAEEFVEQGGLADVGTTDNRQARSREFLGHFFPVEAAERLPDFRQ